MALAIRYNTLAIKTGNSTSFGATGGVEPYVFSVVAGGPGGSINPSSGLYTSPGTVGIDTIRVTDAAAATADVKIMVGTPLELLCDILRREMGLAAGRVYLYNQKIFEPGDNDLYIVVQLLTCKPFGSSKRYPSSGSFTQDQFVSMQATVQIDVISRSTQALYRKEEVLLALVSDYSERQQELNSFKISRIPVGFVNLSQEDGAAVPYRFNIAVNLQYAFMKSSSTAYYDSFEQPEVNTDPEQQ